MHIYITEYDKKPVEELEDACCHNDKVTCLNHRTYKKDIADNTTFKILLIWLREGQFFLFFFFFKSHVVIQVDDIFLRSDISTNM